MLYIVRIDPTGDVTPVEGRDVLASAQAGLVDLGLGGYTGPSPWGDWINYDRPTIDVCSTRWHDFAPLPVTGTTVFVVHEWGRLMGLPVNVKAWSMYGRSPLCGPVWVAADGCESPLSDRWVDVMRGKPLWINATVRSTMASVAQANGLTIPDGALA